MTTIGLLVGCCGRSGLTLEDYSKRLGLLEVQDTFYRIIAREKTILGWRRRAGEGFVFVMKAFQGLTHTSSSPTWRKAGRLPFPANPANFGHLKGTTEVAKSWEYTVREAELLGAKAVVVQLPASFKPSEGSISRISEFFSSARKPTLIGIEVRGDYWRSKEWAGKLREALSAAGLTHVVDPLVWDPLHVEDNTAYFRLHGKLPGYNYQYMTEELMRIARKAAGYRECFVLFNNLSMLEDAVRLRSLVAGEGARLPGLEERAARIARKTRFPTTLAQVLRRHGFLRVGAKGEPTLEELLSSYRDVKLNSPDDLLALVRRVPVN